MRYENRAVRDRAPEVTDIAIVLPQAGTPKHHLNPTMGVRSKEEDERQPQPGTNAQSQGETGSPRGLIQRLISGLRRHRNRMALLELDDDQLKDIGLSRCQVYGDYNRYSQSQSHSLERRHL
jgi:uncharacterized protein YjiS (DUF1127 family)